MFAISRGQRDSFRRAQLDRFAGEAELFLRRHFEPRLRPCSPADVREAALRMHAAARARGLTRRAELLTCLACACVCGLDLFDDPRCAWLFHEDPRPGRAEPVLDCNIDTFAANLAAPAHAGWFPDDPLAACEAAVTLGERALAEPGATLERALGAMLPARAALLATPRLGEFLAAADEAAARSQVGPRARTRHTLIAWVLGVGFVDDPLCRPVLPFLRAAEPGAAG